MKLTYYPKADHQYIANYNKFCLLNGELPWIGNQRLTVRIASLILWSWMGILYSRTKRVWNFTCMCKWESLCSKWTNKYLKTIYCSLYSLVWGHNCVIRLLVSNRFIWNLWGYLYLGWAGMLLLFLYKGHKITPSSLWTKRVMTIY